MEKQKIKKVEDLKVYQKAVKLYDDFMEKDLPLLQKSFAGRTLSGNQLRCIDSICANLEEGYERISCNDVKNFFRMSKGSVGEARGRYKRLTNLLSERTIDERVAALSEIRAMLESLIQKWQ